MVRVEQIRSPVDMESRDAEFFRRDADFFRSIPWAAALLDQPDVQLRPQDSRRRKPSNEDSLMGATFNTASTVSAGITFFKTPAPDAVQVEEVSTLMSIGTGLDGWPQIMHGGIVATIIDESMGILAWTNHEFHRQYPGRNEGPNRNMNVIGGGGFTAELKITYKAPVRTPGALLVTSKFVRRDGRKDWLASEVRQFDEKTQKLALCATGEALFLARRAQL